MGGERIVNYNKWLYGPGPVKRSPTGLGSYYGRLPAKQGFTMAAFHGVLVALGASFIFKWGWGDPQIKAIEDYYKENPPK